DSSVTGVQTCALPISNRANPREPQREPLRTVPGRTLRRLTLLRVPMKLHPARPTQTRIRSRQIPFLKKSLRRSRKTYSLPKQPRSEERRVGKEGTYRR